MRCAEFLRPAPIGRCRTHDRSLWEPSDDVAARRFAKRGARDHTIAYFSAKKARVKEFRDALDLSLNVYELQGLDKAFPAPRKRTPLAIS